MKGKRIFYTEAVYFAGLIILALGTVLMEKANFGMSMVVAPAYLLHLKVSRYLPFFSFGMSEYVFQALLLILLSLVNGGVKKRYLLSFATAFLYGLLLDALMGLLAGIPGDGLLLRAGLYTAGLLICAVGVALLFHTYFPPEAYELVVKEFSEKFHQPIGKVKTIYDCCSCGLGVILSLSFFGGFIGVRWGTVVCAVVNGWLIGRISRLLENRFDFRDALPFRSKLH